MSVTCATQKFIDAGLVLADHDEGDMTRGHISVRVPGDNEKFFMKAHSIGFDEITVENILTIDLDGNVTAGNAKRHSEVFIHSEIYRAREDVDCVIHTHSTYSTALSSTGRPVKAISQGGAIFAGALPVYAQTIELIRSPELGHELAKTLGDNSGVLLKNHGLVMTGRTIDEAVILLLMLEKAAHMQIMLEAAGGIEEEFPADQIFRLKANLMEPRQFNVNFEYLVRRAKRHFSI